MQRRQDISQYAFSSAGLIDSLRSRWRKRKRERVAVSPGGPCLFGYSGLLVKNSRLAPFQDLFLAAAVDFFFGYNWTDHLFLLGKLQQSILRNHLQYQNQGIVFFWPNFRILGRWTGGNSWSLPKMRSYHCSSTLTIAALRGLRI